MEMLRIFLAARSRGEDACLILENQEDKSDHQVQKCGDSDWNTSCCHQHLYYQEAAEPSQGQEVSAQTGEVPEEKGGVQGD